MAQRIALGLDYTWRNTQARNRELTEALEQQTATSEILRVIASSPTDIQPVLDTMLANAVRLSGATEGHIQEYDGQNQRFVAHYNVSPEEIAALRALPQRPARESWSIRAVHEKKPIHIHDVQAEPDYHLHPAAGVTGSRTLLFVPLLRENTAIGTINIRRRDIVKPFTEREIELVKTFADQAVIAIENVRLFNEIKDALEQQTATSEILRVIASSPTDIQPVLDVIGESAARLCSAKDVAIRLVERNILRLAAHQGSIPFFAAPELPINRDSVLGRAVVDGQLIHVEDLQSVAATEFPETWAITERAGDRTILAVPLMREDVAIGVIVIRRTEFNPFTDKQIALLKTFADQAVIAIENVRLFQELQAKNRDLTEALEQQTATSEVLKVISRSTFDLEPVLETLIENATNLCDAEKGSIARPDGDVYRIAVSYGNSPESKEFLERNPIPPLGQKSVTGRVISERRTVHIHDVLADPDYQWSEAQKVGGFRTILGVPMLRDGIPIGVIAVWRNRVQPFTEKQIELVTTFADQAVIAIENVRLFNEIKEALEQQTATSEILGVIASSPTDIQPVLDVVAKNAARLCNASDAIIARIDGNNIQPVAHYGPIPTVWSIGERRPLNRGDEAGRAIIDRQTIHIHDITTEFDTESTVGKENRERSGSRTILTTPLLRESIPIGVITIRRTEVRPFTEKQIALLKTFADQAVIAIENVRLFQELKESLEQQTATSEILGVIANSPTNIQPVLDTVAATAARLCEATDASIRFIEGDGTRLVASFGTRPGAEFMPFGPGSLGGRAILGREIIHVPDLRAELSELPGQDFVRSSGTRTFLCVPMLREGTPIGLINIRRTEVRPFSEKQIALLKTFADQVVIAIENVRLFNEIKEALEQQTATSEILGVIASSPTDIQPVLNVVTENAARLCDAANVGIHRLEGGVLRRAALYGSIYSGPVGEESPIVGSPLGRAIEEKETIHVHDLAEAVETEFPRLKEFQERSGVRTTLATPLLREGIPVGAITVRRTEVRPFTDKQIALLKTFADQAVIAIENVRLFQELKESLEQQTATSEILGVIANSPTNIQPVLETVAATAARLCEATDAQIRFIEGDGTRLVASFGTLPAPAFVPISQRSPGGRAILGRQIVHIHDWQSENPARETFAPTRTFLSVPMLREGNPIGLINIRRTEVRPFSEKQIALLKTFADQAVIAIENVRLFNEIKEALEQQTATSEILGVIASSPTDIQPVLDVVAERAARLCDSNDALIHRIDGNRLKTVANLGPLPRTLHPGSDGPRSIDRYTLQGRAIVDRQTIHIHDLAEEPEDDLRAPFARSIGIRTVLVTPLLREGVPIGSITIRRTEVRPFSDKQIALLKTFAGQAVIAIENVRLFQELQDRTSELARSVGELKALGEVGQAVSSTLDIETVLSTIVGRAVQLSGTHGGVIYEYNEATQEFLLRASHGMETEVVEGLRAAPIRLGEGAAGRAAAIREPVQVPDIINDQEYNIRSSRSVRPNYGAARLSIPSFGTAAPRTADHGSLIRLETRDGKF